MSFHAGVLLLQSISIASFLSFQKNSIKISRNLSGFYLIQSKSQSPNNTGPYRNHSHALASLPWPATRVDFSLCPLSDKSTCTSGRHLLFHTHCIGSPSPATGMPHGSTWHELFPIAMTQQACCVHLQVCSW